uniref:Uncharacterized protein LOC104248625 n=1 Tax=Nicotiana sylvestris TaxID=4096 RepID=A0A1U7YWV4_NICSY
MAEVFVAFVKKIQVKMKFRVVCIRLDHGTEFDNVKFYDFCNENGISHNFSAPRTPQQNSVVEIKNRTLEEMKNVEEDQDVEPLLVPAEVINMTNGKADMMSEMKEANEDNTASSSTEPSTSITTTKHHAVLSFCGSSSNWRILEFSLR